jgi:hypothetical protein
MAAAKKKRKRQGMARLMTKAAFRAAASRVINDALDGLLDGIVSAAFKDKKRGD